MTRHAHHHSDYLDLWLHFFCCSLCAEERNETYLNVLVIVHAGSAPKRRGQAAQLTQRRGHIVIDGMTTNSSNRFVSPFTITILRYNTSIMMKKYEKLSGRSDRRK